MAQVTHFYHWTWDYTAALPLRLFWTLVKSMNRLRAEENLRQVYLSGFHNLAENTKTEYIRQQEQTIGTIVVSEDRDAEGISKLKNLGG